ncbi:MAG: TetR family transcriptional regulator [Polaromonas sp.]
MARRTKQEAQETRNHLLDAAEHLFQAQGVSRTSLQDIARRAGATRGAVYWHFKDKADLFNAMMDRITLPMEEKFSPEPEVDTQQAKDSAAPQADSGAQALERIRQAMLSILNLIVTDPQTRRVLEVATHKVEYVEDLMAVRQRHLNVRSGFLLRVEQSLQDASATQPDASAAQRPSPTMAAQGLHALIDGLVQNWLLDPQAFDLLEVGQYAIDVYLQGLGLASTQEKSPK